MATDSPAGASKALANWLAIDAGCRPSLAWVVEPDAAPLEFLAWPDSRDGVGRQRVDHVFAVEPNSHVGPQLHSLCGQTFVWSDLEFAEGVGVSGDHVCLGCLRARPTPMPVSRDREVGAGVSHWAGWGEYYCRLEWPVFDCDGRLVLKSSPDSAVVALSLPCGLGEQVQEVLADTEMQAPALVVPSWPDELVFVVRTFGACVPVPSVVRVLTTIVPLVPSSTSGGAVKWHTNPDEVPNLRRCQDRHLLAVAHRLLSTPARTSDRHDQYLSGGGRLQQRRRGRLGPSAESKGAR